MTKITPNFKIKRLQYHTTEKGKKICDGVLTFDIETTSLFRVGSKWVTGNREETDIVNLTEATSRIAICYLWQMSLDGENIYGRTLGDFVDFLESLNNVNPEKKYIWVHNLAFEFAFLTSWLIKKGYRVENVLARKPHAVMSFTVPDLNIEFRCTLFLTRLSLDNLAKSFVLGVKKLVGDLDYTLLRTPQTELTENELQYAENDVEILYRYIKFVELKEYKTLDNIPLTQTGKVRRVVKREVLNSQAHKNMMYKNKMDLTNYRLLTRVFSGGYVAANFTATTTEDYDNIIYDVYSYDRNSSYPAEMVTKAYPAEPFVKTTDYYNKFYAYIYHIRLTNVISKTPWAYLSFCKCEVAQCVNMEIDNGRVFSAEFLDIWVTDIDLDIINMCYNYDSIDIVSAYRAFKRYLPIEYVNYVLDLYNNKTLLKGDDEKIVLYKKSKEFINSLYGMCVTNTIRDNCEYDNGMWIMKELSTSEIENKLFTDKPFLMFSWGVWITAYARRELWKVISKIGHDCKYSDTDSVKVVNIERSKKIIDEYNAEHLALCQSIATKRNIPFERFCPKDILIGRFAYEGMYKQFKTMGAKKYCYVDENGHFCHVVSGCRKSYLIDGQTMPTITKMSQFKPNQTIPHGKSVIWYTNNQPHITITDYQGREYTTEDDSGVVILDGDYNFSLHKDYLNFLQSTHNIYSNPLRTKM